MLKQSSPEKADNQSAPSYPNLEFHLRQALDQTYALNLPMFALESGRFKIDYHELQNLIHRLGELEPEQGFMASELHGMGLLSLLSHKAIRLYRNQVNPAYIKDLTAFLDQEMGSAGLDELLTNYLEALPSESYKSSSMSVKEYLVGDTQAVPNIQIVVEELLVHIMALNNPAFEKYDIVFKEDFHKVIKTSDKLLKRIQKWSSDATGFGSDGKNIIDLLLEPILAAPDSIEDQLSFIRQHWGNYLGSHLLDLLRGLDHFEEENRFRGFGPGESQVPSYSGELQEGEYYSEDSDWMPRVVMIARNSLVWLDQLSKKYQRDIKTLHDIPDQELDLLAQQGFTVLWLIGLWNRSSISKKIKHWCGNPDAESSAYSLKEYSIDPSIGGPEALENLKSRAWERGIRLASDMVPNHTGLDSDWLKQHPDWYISTNNPPFPAYQFDGGDLSDDPELSIHLEDHYYDRSDAAVVFKAHDHRSGSTRYIYHGNDGTSMPWNDTAQLNYLNPELREAIIQTILDVARQFKVIRFDAAMTLAKRHVQRLWFPEPGSGGDIPSRAGFSMSGVDFDAAIPAEFWREVVDRVATEVPDTLLLAEAFWMMESYFVRTLGMHRVYNSAFMNMLKMEENGKFFEMIAKTLEFDPRILQRFVNFLSNPDEDTAIAQFGKGDKYFGATVLMVTLPGLPMFAHAQIEGFEEKYGMEYRRAYWDETPDEDLINRHKDLIFPLMKKRYLYAGSGNFRLFPFMNNDGHRVESVFAYTNHSGTERSLVMVNNSYSSQSGWIKTSTLFNTDPTIDKPELVAEDLIIALSFDVDDSYYVIFQEQVSKLWYIRTVAEIRNQGLYMELSGYESQIYLGFQLVSDSEAIPWWNIHQDLDGRGIDDFAPLFRRIELEPVHHLFCNMMTLIISDEVLPDSKSLFMKFAPLLEAMLEMENISLLIEDIEDFARNFEGLISQSHARLTSMRPETLEQHQFVAASTYFARQIHAANPESAESMVATYGLEEPINKCLSTAPVVNLAGLLSVLEYADRARALLARDTQTFFINLFKHGEVLDYLQVNEAEGVEWFSQERMDNFLKVFTVLYTRELPPAESSRIYQAVKNSDFKLKTFLKNLLRD
ncbi:MAG: alpha-amylase [Candidatus Marinimicrobia bacterium]|nr:alpha-amylase [Candidatus Neomarinimicrobiota bacterium]MBT5313788.1 alpha-amylase [Candidatus Neomarinimicrobiota bacterium]